MINSKFSEIEKNRGITLIALVVTIIVLLILAGISISMLTGQNGILNRASEAKEKTELGQKQEKSDIASLEDLINESVDGTSVEQVSDKNPGVLEQDASDSNVYIINSIEDLVFFAYDVGNNDNTYEGKTVKLSLSLDFNSSKSYVDAFRTDYGKYGYNGELKTLLTSGEGFLPVGSIIDGEQDISKRFSGTFDGSNFEIKNCFVHSDAVDTKKVNRIAFFSCSVDGEVKNLGLVNIKYSLTNYNDEGSVSGIAISTSKDTKISNCWVTGNIKQDSKGTGAVNCSGIITYNSGIIENCYNLANIQAETNNEKAGCYVGGIVVNNENNYITNCYNKGEIKAKGSADIFELGGIARISGNSNNEIKNSYNQGSIEGEIENARLVRLGGILGVGPNLCATNLNNIYNSGKITVRNADKITGYLHIGGVIGEYGGLNNKLSIENAYNIASFYIHGTARLALIGAICGEDTSATTINNSYFLNSIPYSSIGKENSSGDNIDIKSITSNQKQELLTNLNKDGNNSWKNDDKNINKGYPILSWQ